jgi:hypothetical protein
MRNKWINKNEKYKVQSRRDQIIHIIPICSKGRDQQKKTTKTKKKLCPSWRRLKMTKMWGRGKTIDNWGGKKV